MTISSAMLSVALSVVQQGVNTFADGPMWGGGLSQSLSFSDGVGANQCNIAYLAERTVATGATDTIDLNGVLTDALGASIAGVEVVGILIINRQKDGTANTTNLTIGGASNTVPLLTGGTTPSVAAIRPGGIFLIANPDANGVCPMVAGSSDILAITNSAGATNKYLIAVLARNA